MTETRAESAIEPRARYVETDQRGRASIGHSSAGYLMREESDGTIILEPASVISDLERRFLADAALQARIEHARRHPEDSVPRKRRGQQ